MNFMIGRLIAQSSIYKSIVGPPTGQGLGLSSNITILSNSDLCGEMSELSQLFMNVA